MPSDMTSPARWLAIAGPTASGKTAAALAVAAHMPVEIISVDSALVYRGMDIGTAKPNAEELGRVPHHLIDILDPKDAYSAAQFVADAHRLIDAIRGRGRLPLLVGGTMLYFKALQEGLDAMPSADPEMRAAVDAEAAQRGWPALHAELARVDPATAERLAPNDAQRIQRALEVWRSTGRPLSSFHRKEGGTRAAEGALVSLEPSDRGWLHARIAERFDAMLRAGFVDEVLRLRSREDLHLGLPSMRCVGYRQAWETLDAVEAGTLNADAFEAEVRERGIAATRQLAKRQLTWLRSMPWRRVIACDLPSVIEETIALVHGLKI